MPKSALITPIDLLNVQLETPQIVMVRTEGTRELYWKATDVINAGALMLPLIFKKESSKFIDDDPKHPHALIAKVHWPTTANEKEKGIEEESQCK